MPNWIRQPAPYDHEKTLHQNRFRDSGSVRCSCGKEHDLERRDSCCTKCVQMFNPFGQQLAPPEQWDPDEDY